jgi:hypothetical protein
MGRPRKDGTPAKPHINKPQNNNDKLSYEKLVDVRLSCLEFVVDSGSTMDRKSPQQKAQEYVDFVLDGKFKSFIPEFNSVQNAIRNKEVMEASKVPAVFIEPKEENVISSPFGTKAEGVKSVLIS